MDSDENKANNCIICHCDIKGIPLLFIYHQSIRSQQNVKIIFLFHKLLENKEAEIPFAYQLAMQNYFVILMDIYGHGERPDSFDKFREYDFSCVTDHVYKTAKEIDQVKDGVTEIFGNIFDLINITCIGVSLGASVSVISGYLYPYIKRVVSVISSFDWKNNVIENGFRSLRMFSKKQQKFKRLDILALIDEYYPLSNYKMLSKLPHSLYLAGVLDAVAPINVLDLFIDQMKEIYISKGAINQLEVNVYEKTGHQFSQQMKNDVLKWLDKTNELI